MSRRFLYCFILFITVACSRYPLEVIRAIKFAGDNRAELEKVLEHYSKRPEDSLKLKAAYFLIANLPYHFTVQDERLDSFKIYLREKELHEGLWTTFEKEVYKTRKENVEIKRDIFFITSEFLIRNIDFSFYRNLLFE